MSRHKCVECPDCGLNHVIDADHVDFEQAENKNMQISCGECSGGGLEDTHRVGASTLIPIEVVPDRFLGTDLNVDDDHLQRESAGTPFEWLN
jgi:hypothetical protein